MKPKEKLLIQAKTLLYLKTLNSLSFLLPSSFLKDETIDRSSPDFKVYVTLLDHNISLLKKFDSEDKAFRDFFILSRLKNLVQAAQKSPWWKGYFALHNITPGDIQSMTDLSKIPPVTRGLLTYIDRKELLTTEPKPGSVLMRSSGGSSTGVSFSWGHNKSFFYINIASRFIKEINRLGFNFADNKTKGFYFQFNFPHRPPSSPFRWFMDYDTVVKTNETSFDEKIREFCKKIALTGSCVLRTSPTELLFLVNELKRLDLHPRVDFCLVVGGFLGSDLRKSAEDYLGAPVIVHYGTQEVGPFSIECRNCPGLYHIFEERVIVEVLNENNDIVADGAVGDITVTSLDNTMMPLIRYKIGDTGILHKNPKCHCGNNAPLIEVRGRETDFLISKDNKRYSARPLLQKMNQEPLISSIRRYQIRQAVKGCIEITLEKTSSTNVEAEIITFCRTTYPTFTATVTQTDHITQNTPKFKIFIPISKD